MQNKRSQKDHKNHPEEVILRIKQKLRFQNKSNQLKQVRNRFYKRFLKRFLLISLVLVFQANWILLSREKQELLLLEKLQNNHQNLKILLFKMLRKVEEKREKLRILQNKLLTHLFKNLKKSTKKLKKKVKKLMILKLRKFLLILQLLSS